MDLPGCSEETNKRKTQMYTQSVGIGWSGSLLRNHGALEAHHVYYKDLHEEVGLLHTTEQGGRVIIYNYTR